MLKSVLCDLLGIRYPVLQGGMAWIADGRLAAAVSNGGGLGIIAAGNAPAGYVAEQIRGGAGGCRCARARGDHWRGESFQIYGALEGGRDPGDSGGCLRRHGEADDAPGRIGGDRRGRRERRARRRTDDHGACAADLRAVSQTDAAWPLR